MEQQWQEFLGIIQKAQHKFIPTRKPWLTREVKDSIKAKERAYREARNSGKPEDWEPFKSKQKATKKIIRVEKVKYEAKLASIIGDNIIGGLAMLNCPLVSAGLARVNTLL